MKQNPAFMVLVVVAIVAAVAAVVLLALSMALGGVGGIEWWVALIPAAVAVLAGLGAVMLWGMSRQST